MLTCMLDSFDEGSRRDWNEPVTTCFSMTMIEDRDVVVIDGNIHPRYFAHLDGVGFGMGSRSGHERWVARIALHDDGCAVQPCWCPDGKVDMWPSYHI